MQSSIKTSQGSESRDRNYLEKNCLGHSIEASSDDRRAWGDNRIDFGGLAFVGHSSSALGAHCFHDGSQFSSIIGTRLMRWFWVAEK